jgi:hypothetical protein
LYADSIAVDAEILRQQIGFADGSLKSSGTELLFINLEARDPVSIECSNTFTLAVCYEASGNAPAHFAS